MTSQTSAPIMSPAVGRRIKAPRRRLFHRIGGHSDPITSVSLADVALAASACRDQTIRLWCTDTGACLRIIQLESPATAASLNGRGTRLASGAEGGRVQIWDVASGRCLNTIDMESPVTAVALDRRGATLAAASRSGAVLIWDMADARCQKVIQMESPGTAVALNESGTVLAVGCESGVVQVRNLGGGGEGLRVFEGHSGAVNSVSLNAKGTVLASASSDRTVRVWNVSGGCLGILGHPGPVNSVSLDARGDCLASASDDSRARIWRVSTGQSLAVYDRHPREVLAVCLSRDGETLITGGKDALVLKWDVRNGTHRELSGHTHGVMALDFREPHCLVAAGWGDHAAKRWDMESGLLQMAYRGSTEALWSIATTQDMSQLATASADRSARVYDLASGLCLMKADHDAPVMAVSTHGSSLATASADVARIWDVNSGLCVATCRGHTASIMWLGFSPDGRELMTAGSDQTARRWDLAGECRMVYRGGHSDAIWAASFNGRDGGLLLTGGADKTVVLWDAGGHPIRTYSGHSDAVTSLCFSADGRRFLSASVDKEARLWDVSGDLLTTFCGHENGLFGACFGRDGRTVITASGDRTMKFWAETGCLLGTLYNTRQGHLWTTPPDPSQAPSGWFWTDRPDLVHVIECDEEDGGYPRALREDDPRRLAYLDKYNSQKVVMDRVNNPA